MKRISDVIGLPIPGEGGKQDNRVAGLGPLLGIVAGVATGAVVGAARGARLVDGRAATAAAATVLGMLAGNLPMTVAGLTDPRQWSASDWLADLVPHLAYGAVTAVVLEAVDNAP